MDIGEDGLPILYSCVECKGYTLEKNGLCTYCENPLICRVCNYEGTDVEDCEAHICGENLPYCRY